ncbi:retrovirus-related pol polyprotein from transposon TNT 1-94 [Tanacetum coccineum]
MLIRSKVVKLTAASASEFLFADFLSEIEPKKVSEAQKHPGLEDAMQVELKQFYRNKVWTLVPLPYRKIAISSKWVFRFKKDKVGTVVRNKVSLVAQGYSQEKGIDYDKTFAPDNASVKTHMVPLNNLGPDLAGKPVNETLYRGMIGYLMYLTVSMPEIQFSTCLCARYQANPKQLHLIDVKRSFMYLKGTPSLGLWYPKCSGFDLKRYSDLDYASCNMERKSTLATQAVTYAPQCGDMAVESVQFQSSNFVENFSYPQSVPTYKAICKFLMNCPLAEAFIKTPLVLYQNFLGEFWCIAVPLALDYKTFCESTGLDYNKDNYVAHPSPEAVKAELDKIATNEALVQKNLVLKTSFPMAWRILLTFVIQVLSRNYSSTKQLNSIQEFLAYFLLIGTKVDIGEIIYNDLVTRLMTKTRQKYVSYPRFVSCTLEVLLGSEYSQDPKFRNLPNALSQSNITRAPSKVTRIELMASMIDVINQESSVTP